MEETFKMDDKRSTRKLSKNKRGEENSARAYRIFMLRQLEKHGGVMTGEQLEKALLKNYEHTFGPDDRRWVKCGKGRRRKWQNTLDWAKAIAFKDGEVATRSCQVNKVKVTYIVLLDPGVTPEEWIDWAISKRIRHGFSKKCRCGKDVPLSLKKHRKCGYVFPAPNRRIDRIPR